MTAGSSNLAENGKPDAAAELFARACRLHQQGHLEEATRRYAQVLAAKPDHADCLHLLGILKHQTGDDGAALTLIGRAITASPEKADYHFNLGTIHFNRQDLAEAGTALARTLELEPEHAGALSLRGQLRARAGQLKDAEADLCKALELAKDGDPAAHIALFDIKARQEDAAALQAVVDEALALYPRNAAVFHHAGEALRRMERIHASLPLYEKAIELDPSLLGAYCSLGIALATLKKADAGRTILLKAIRRCGNEPALYVGLAMVEHAADNYQACADACSRAIELAPDFAEAYNTLGRALAASAMYEEAVAAYQKAIEINPAMTSAMINLGSSLQSLGFPDKALDFYQVALSIDPSIDLAYWNLSLALLAVGRIEEGWDLFGYGFLSKQRQPYRPFPGLLWDGSPLEDKTILVWREQGIGDDIRFSSVYPDICEQAKQVIIETDPRLVPLYQRSFPKALVRPENFTSTGLGNMEKVDFDVTAPAGMAASHLRRHLSDFPEKPGHLVPDPARVQFFSDWLETLGPGPKIGFSWRSRLMSATRGIFYTQPEDWLDLFSLENVHFINLQYDNASGELQGLRETHGILIHEAPDVDLFNDIDGAAALSKALDLAVSSITSVADIAAAVGTPVFTYGPARHPAKLGTDHVPWFPSIRICDMYPTFTPKEECVAAVTRECRAYIETLQKDPS